MLKLHFDSNKHARRKNASEVRTRFSLILGSSVPGGSMRCTLDGQMKVEPLGPHNDH